MSSKTVLSAGEDERDESVCRVGQGQEHARAGDEAARSAHGQQGGSCRTGRGQQSGEQPFVTGRYDADTSPARQRREHPSA